MSVTLSRNLRLRIDSNLTASARYNLEVLDSLGGTFQVDSLDTTQIRARGDITIEPAAQEVGGTGTGGVVSLGIPGNQITLNISGIAGLLDQATGGSKYLRLRYKSDLNGGSDTMSDRVLSFDLEGADRSMILGGNLGISGGDLTLGLVGATSLSLPTSGTLATLGGTEVLTGKTLSASQNTITGLTDASIAAGAAIAYSKLALPSQTGNSGKFLTTDGSTPSWATVSGGGGGSAYTTTWTSGDGTTKIITHGLNNQDVEVVVQDQTGEIIHINTAVVTGSNTVSLNSSEAPASTWRVLILAS